MPARVRGLLAGLLLGLVLPAAVVAQGPLAASVSPAAVAFPAPGVADFENGSVGFDGVTVDVQTRGFVIWILRIRADDPDLGGYGKPLADLQWRQGGGAWQSITTGGQVVAFGFTSRTLTLDFRTLLSWASDVPGDYGTGITFEVTSLFGGATATARTAAGSALPAGESPSSVCARVAVAVRGRRGAGEAGGGGASPAGATEERCLRALRDARPSVTGGRALRPRSR